MAEGQVATPLVDVDEAQQYSRILGRDLKGRQSAGVFNVRRKNTEQSLFWLDLFHSVVNLSGWYLLLLVLLLYFAGFLIFTPLYYAYAPNKCDTGFETFLDAFYFSVITMMTIGYGSQFLLPECASLVVLIAFQSVIGTILDAIAIGFVYDRLSAARIRGDTIIFGDKAVLRPLGVDDAAGVVHFALCMRYVESRSHQLTEAHVRAFGIHHTVAPPPGTPQSAQRTAKQRLLTLSRLLTGEDPWEATTTDLTVEGGPGSTALRRRAPVSLAPATAVSTADAQPWLAGTPGSAVQYFTAEPLRLCRPSDELGATSLPLLPSEAVHRVSLHFTLLEAAGGGGAGPHPTAVDVGVHLGPPPAPRGVRFHGTSPVDDEEDGHMLFSPLAPSTGLVGSWGAMGGSSGATGEATPSTLAWREGAVAPAAPPAPPAPGLAPAELTPLQRHAVTLAARDVLLRSWRDTGLEIVGLVEGIDEITSDTCQARHSYTVGDVVWNGLWAPCVFPGGADGVTAEVDYAAFHSVLTPPDPDAFHPGEAY